MAYRARSPEECVAAAITRDVRAVYGKLGLDAPEPVTAAEVAEAHARIADSARIFQTMMERDVQDPIMQFFRSGHLPNELQDVALPFESVAKFVVATLPRNPERTVALRKLLEAKDCAVRAKLFRESLA